MSTIIQKRVARRLKEVLESGENIRLDELVVSSGYSVTTGDRHTKQVLKSKGVREELKLLGFSEEAADNVVQTILHDKRLKPTDRLKAGELIYKRLGSFAPDKHLTATISLSDLLLKAKQEREEPKNNEQDKKDEPSINQENTSVK